MMRRLPAKTCYPELTWYLFKVDNKLCVLRVDWGGFAVDEDVLTGPRRTNCNERDGGRERGNITKTIFVH